MTGTIRRVAMLCVLSAALCLMGVGGLEMTAEAKAETPPQATLNYYDPNKLPPSKPGSLDGAQAAFDAGDYQSAALIWTGHALAGNHQAALKAARAYFQTGDIYKTPLEKLMWQALGEDIPGAFDQMRVFYEGDAYYKARIDRMFRGAGKRGMPVGRLAFGIVYTRGVPPHKQPNLSIAHHQLQFCIDENPGYAPCLYWLAQNMLEPQSPVYNPQQAQALISKAARLGHWGAQNFAAR